MTQTTMCRLFSVSGRVQGVAFRASTRHQAQTLAIAGYAKNLPDGRVEVLAYGSASSLQALEDWLWQGPVHARVTHVEARDYSSAEIPTNFVIA